MSRLNKNLKSILSHELALVLKKLPSHYDGYLMDEMLFFKKHEACYDFINHQSRLELYMVKHNRLNKIDFNNTFIPLINEIEKILQGGLVYRCRKYFNSMADDYLTHWVNKAFFYNNIIDNLSTTDKIKTYYVHTMKFDCCGQLILINDLILTTWDFLVAILRCLESHMTVLLGLFIDKDSNSFKDYQGLLDSYFQDLATFGDKSRKLLSSMINYPKFLMASKEFPNHTRYKVLLKEVNDEFPGSKMEVYLRNLNERRSLMLSGCLKSFGYVTIDIDQSHEYFKSMMQKTTVVKNDIDKKTLNTFKFLFINSYLRKHGTMPNLTNTNSDLIIYKGIDHADIRELESITFGKTFEYDYNQKVIDMIKDTAFMPGRHYVANAFDIHVNNLLYKDLPFKHAKRESRRFVIKYLESEPIDMKQFIDNIDNNFSTNDLIIKYDVKSHEQKEKGREFGTLSYKGKILQISRIHNFQDFIKYFDDFTGMSKNTIDIDKITRDCSKKLSNDNIIFLMIDFKDYAGSFSFRNMFRMLKCIDDLYGVKVFEYFCKMPNDCWHVKSYRYQPFKKQFSTTSNFMPNGFDQYAWTINTICLIYNCLYSNFGLSFDLTLTGDNCAIILDFTTFRLSKSSVDKKFSTLVDIIINDIRDNGQDVKPNEFLYSRRYYEYLKKCYYFGKKLREPCKYLMKVLSSDDSEYSTISDRIASIFSSCITCTKQLKYQCSSFILASCLTIILLKYSGVQLSLTQSLVLLFSNSIFNRVPSLSPTKFLISGDIDPLTDWFYWFKVIQRINQNLSMELIKFNLTNRLYLNSNQLKEKLLLNPYYLPLRKTSNLREHDEEFIKNYFERNLKNKALSFIRRYPRDKLLSNLCSSLPLEMDPLIMNTIYNVSNVGVVDLVTSKITKTSSFASMSIKRDYDKIINVRKTVMLSYIIYKSSGSVSNYYLTALDKCSRTLADSLRTELLPGFYIKNLSTTHPIEVIGIGYSPSIIQNFSILTSTDNFYYDGSFNKRLRYSNWDCESAVSPLSNHNDLILGPLSKIATDREANSGDTTLRELLKLIWSERIINDMPIFTEFDSRNVINKLSFKNNYNNYLKLCVENTKYFDVNFENTPISRCGLYTINFGLMEASIYLNLLLNGSLKLHISCIECIRKSSVVSGPVSFFNYQPVFIESSFINPLKVVIPTKKIKESEREIVTLSVELLRSAVTGKKLNISSPIVKYDKMLSNFYYLLKFVQAKHDAYILADLMSRGIIPDKNFVSIPLMLTTTAYPIKGLDMVEPSSGYNSVTEPKSLIYKSGTFNVYNLTSTPYRLEFGYISILALLRSCKDRNLFSSPGLSRFFNSIVPGSVSVYKDDSCSIFEDMKHYELYDRDSFISDNIKEVNRIYGIINQKYKNQVSIFEKQLFGLQK